MRWLKNLQNLILILLKGRNIASQYYGYWQNTEDNGAKEI